MHIKVGGLVANYGAHYATPGARARSLGHSAGDYALAVRHLRASHNQVGAMFAVTMPLMHQTLELLTKALAYLADPTFDPKAYGHKVVMLLTDYSARIPLFATLLNDPDTKLLVTELEKAYLGVRYGESVLTMDGDAWDLFIGRAEELFVELERQTGLSYPR